jgi:hypothetical protein
MAGPSVLEVLRNPASFGSRSGLSEFFTTRAQVTAEQQRWCQTPKRRGFARCGLAGNVHDSLIGEASLAMSGDQIPPALSAMRLALGIVSVGGARLSSARRRTASEPNSTLRCSRSCEVRLVRPGEIDPLARSSADDPDLLPCPQGFFEIDGCYRPLGTHARRWRAAVADRCRSANTA